MSTLFIIDQSLREIGGHHYDYTRLVARAAAESGLTPVIGTNRQLHPDCANKLQPLAEVVSPFRATTYTHLSRLAGLRQLTHRGDPSSRSFWPQQPRRERGRLYNWLGHRARNRRNRQRDLIIGQFAEDCESFFSGFSFDDEDHVLFTTLSELEFMGLAAYLGTHPRTLQATWHTQFHFSIFNGRPDEYEAQAATESAITDCIQSALARIPYHDLRGYTTSAELARQYNRIGALQFQNLPYPVDTCLARTRCQRRPGEPLRITVAGGVRREKGQKDRVNRLIESVWDSHAVPGTVQFHLQSGNPGSLTCKQVLGPAQSRSTSESQFRQRVQVHPHPLPETDYANLIHDSDVGLFCYDSLRYFGRRAGILSEFLAAGKPVIVPAGCWLSEQISEPVRQHIEDLIGTASARATLEVTDLNRDPRNAPASGGIISFDNGRTPFQCSLDRQAAEMDRIHGIAIGFRWQWPREPGCFVRVGLEFLDDAGQLLESQTQVVGAGRETRPSRAYFRAPAAFAGFRLAFRNAYSSSSISIIDTRLQLLDFADSPAPPRSAVGIIADGEAGFREAVDEIVAHYEHYLETATGFSRTWSIRHDPGQTIRTLLPASAALPQRRRAA